MEGLLLFALLLLLGFFSSVSTSTEGELCRAWDFGGDPLFGAFQCPERLDGPDAKFCCGTCRAPYCCSSGEARLDQARCSLAAPPSPSLSPAVHAPSVWMLAGFWLTFVILAVLIGHCLCCYSGLFKWVKSRLRGRTRSEAAEPTERGDLLPLPRPRAQAMSRGQAIARLRTMALYPPPPPPPPPCDFRGGSHPIPSDPPPSYSSLDLTGSGAAPLHRSSEEAPQEEVALVPSATLPSGKLSSGSMETSV